MRGSLRTPVESYRRLADIFHDVLAEQSLDLLLERIADTLEDLVPHDALTIFEADADDDLLVPVLARDSEAEKILAAQVRFGEGITGWAAEHREPVLANDANSDPRVRIVPGTPNDEPEALVCVPLVARGSIKGTLNIYRLGEGVGFSGGEFELAKRFADAAALALDNAHIRARLEHQAQTDSLTGLYNHRYFHERLRAELTRASRSRESVAVLMLDIDDFKKVNDVYGHAAGDHILAELAALVRATVRASDVVCRTGGEEFGVIMPSTAVSRSTALARRLTRRIAKLDLGAPGSVTVSVGIAQGPEQAMNPRELVACAEAAMMTAKERGKNGIVLFQDERNRRPDEGSFVAGRDVRSLAHMKMLQSLAGKLTTLREMGAIGEAIATELRSLIDYHNCRIFITRGEDLVPIGFRGDIGLDDGRNQVEALACKVGEGITGHVAATGRALLVEDAANCELAVRVPGTADIDESLVAVPLRYGSRTIGVIVISKLGTGQFDEDDVRLLEVLSGHASAALENARLYEAQRREAEGSRTLLELSRELALARGIDEVLSRLVERSADILGARHASAWVQDGDRLVPKDLWARDEDERQRIEQYRIPLAGTQPFLETGDTFIATPEDFAALDGMPALESAVVIAPVQVDGSGLGCLAVAVEDPAEFREYKLDLFQGIARQAQLAISSALNFESLEQTFVSTVEAFAQALDQSDHYSPAHARSTTDMSLRVGAVLGLRPEQLKRLELGGLFHDIGKIGIEAGILRKAGPLTGAERALVETHPQLGEQIIAPVRQLEDVRTVIRHCHERWDGGGYPDGLAGEEVPIESRIILVCDALHAMTSDRPYRKRLSDEEAGRRLRAGAGSQFDPQVVAATLEVLAANAGAASARRLVKAREVPARDPDRTRMTNDGRSAPRLWT